MADLKITEFAALTVVNDEDLIAIVDDPTGTASTKKIRTDDFQSSWHVGARVYNSANLSIPNTTWTDFTFDTERYDTDTIHSTGTNTGQLTCKTAGKYLIIGQVQWDINAVGSRFVGIFLNNTTYLDIVETETNTIATRYTSQNISTIYQLAVNEYVTFRGNQNSGGALNANYTAQISPEFMMHRIG